MVNFPKRFPAPDSQSGLFHCRFLSLSQSIDLPLRPYSQQHQSTNGSSVAGARTTPPPNTDSHAVVSPILSLPIRFIIKPGVDKSSRRTCAQTSMCELCSGHHPAWVFDFCISIQLLTKIKYFETVPHPVSPVTAQARLPGARVLVISLPNGLPLR